MAQKNKYTSIDLSKYDKGYRASKSVNLAQQQKANAENAVKNYGDFKYGRQEETDKIIDSILNRKDFSYNLDGDALYQQYKDQYKALGKLAMQDAMGQAAALTGGYGNSYADAVGNQAYQGYLTKLNDVIPSLYQMALDRYNAQGDALKDKYGILSDDRNTQYGEWQDKFNRLLNDRGYYSDNYNNAYTRDYSAWNDNRSHDTTQYWNEYNAGYQQERDAIADAQWKKQFDESVRQFNIQQATEKARIAASRAKAQTASKSITPTKTDNTDRFEASMRTKHEFARSSNEDKKKYGSYNQYIAGKIAENLERGDLTVAEAQYLIEKYGLGE